MAELYLHIGLHKTATTYLQRVVFPKIKRLNYIPQEQIYPILKRIMVQDPLIFDEAKTKNLITCHLTNGRNLISAEGLSGSPLLQYMNRSNIICKLYNLFPDAKIIIGIRNQKDMIVSLYKQYVSVGGIKKMSEFIHPKRIIGEPTTDSLDLDTFKYGPYLQNIEEHFGKDNMYIYVYEDLKTNKKEFLKGIVAFMRIHDILEFGKKKYNVSFTNSELRVALLLNRFFKSPRNKYAIVGRPKKFRAIVKILGKLVPNFMSINLDDELKGIENIFAYDNKLIDKKYNLHLEKNHYNKYYS